jgi:hypothetical protein
MVGGPTPALYGKRSWRVGKLNVMATHTTALTLADADRVAIAATIAAIRDRWPVEQVILFGSKARGDDGPESGIDLLVITSKLVDATEENTMQETAWHTGLQYGCVVQLIVRSHDQWWHGIDQATPLRLQIDADGIEIFSR